MLNIYDFIPIYPDFNDLGSNPEFNLFKKKEFYDLKLDRIETRNQEKADFMKHQKIVARFISVYTPYDGILLVHGLGTGKTSASIAAIEGIKNSEVNKMNSVYKGALILMRGKGLINNYKRELINGPTDGIYLPDAKDNTEEKRKRTSNRKIESFYRFETFETFSKYISRLTDKSIISEFSDMIIVIDEVHNLRINNDVSQYANILRMMDLVQNCKKILLSGTPMRDSPAEIASVMNLILPMDKKLPTEDDFIKEYLLQEGEKLVVNPEMKEKLKSYFRGRVSYLRVMQSDTKRTYEGQRLLTYFNLYSVEMSDFQKKHYEGAFNEDGGSDKSHTGIYSNSRQACLFVYPNGSYGSKGYTKYIKNQNMTQELFNELRMGGEEERLNKLQKFSSKYSSCIEKILKEGSGNHFVYCGFVEGSGAILFASILEKIFGFLRYKGEQPGKPSKNSRRFSIITNKTSTQAQINQILKIQGSPDNLYGEYLKVIIGSEIISEGFSLKNIQSVHILTPDWNFGGTEQAIARALRLFSHEDLKREGIDVNVKIYLYCIGGIGQEINIDLKMYKFSEDKDIPIKRIEQLITEASVDCELTKKRNQLSDALNDSRECNYQRCFYDCDGITDYKVPTLDMSTYNLYYDKESVQEMIGVISKKLANKMRVDLDELYEMSLKMFKDKGVAYPTVLKAIYELEEKFIPVKDKLGYNCLVKSQNDYIFLCRDYTSKTFLDSYYTENISLFEANDISQVNDDLEFEKIDSIVTNKEYYGKFSRLSKKAQEVILESILLYPEDVNQSLKDFVLGQYQKFITQYDGFKSSSFLDKYRCLEDDKKEWEWCGEKQIEQIKSKVINKKGELESSRIGSYGIVDSQNNFYIRDVSDENKKKGLSKTQTKTTGKTCLLGYQKKDLLKILSKMKPRLPAEIQPVQRDKILKDLQDDKTKKNYDDLLKAFDYSELQNMDIDALQVLFYYGNKSIKKDIICTVMLRWFDENNLLDRVAEKETTLKQT